MKKHCLEMIMKKPEKIPFGIILAFVFTSCSIKAKQIWSVNFLEWSNSLSFYCTYFLCWVILLYMGKKVSLWSRECQDFFSSLVHYLSDLWLWGWEEWWHLSEAIPEPGTFYLTVTFIQLKKNPWSALKYSMSFPCGGPLSTTDPSPEVFYCPFLPAS